MNLTISKIDFKKEVVNNPVLSLEQFTENDTKTERFNDHYSIYKDDVNFKTLVLFYEYFHGDTSRGVWPSGWTGVIAELIRSTSLSKKH